MRFLLLIFLALNASAAGRIVDGDIFLGSRAYRNYIKNPLPQRNASTGTVTSSATISLDSDAAEKLDGVASFLCNTSSQNGYCEWQTFAIEEGDKTGNCVASAAFKGDGSLYKLQVHDGTSVVASSAVIGNLSDWTDITVNYLCGSTRTVRLTQTEAGTSPAVNIGRIGWSKAASGTSVGPGDSPASWSGYHDATCSFSVTSASFADFGADASCTLVQTSNTNFGTVTLNGSNLPGITFTPAKTGKFLVLVQPATHASNSTQTSGIRLTDGTNTLSESEFYDPSNERAPPTLAGIVSGTVNVPVTLKLQGQTQSGAFNVSTATTNRSISWTVVSLDQPFPAPLWSNSVATSYSGVAREEWVTFATTDQNTACSSSPCTLLDQSGGITSVTRAGTGDYTVNFSVAFSAIPTCTVTGIEGLRLVALDAITTSSVRILSFSNSIPTAADMVGAVRCIGKK